MTLATIMTLMTMMMKTSTKMTSTMMTSTEMITVIFDQSKNGLELELGKIQSVNWKIGWIPVYFRLWRHIISFIYNQREDRTGLFQDLGWVDTRRQPRHVDRTCRVESIKFRGIGIFYENTFVLQALDPLVKKCKNRISGILQVPGTFQQVSDWVVVWILILTPSWTTAKITFVSVWLCGQHFHSLKFWIL